MATTQFESDEAYARSLSTGDRDSQETNDIESSAPLIELTAATDENTIGAARQHSSGQVELSTSRVALNGFLLISIPQVIATVVVLSLYWNESPVAGICRPVSLIKWRVWSLVGGVRLILHLGAILSVMFAARSLDRNSRHFVRLQTMRSLLDVFGMVWFLVGNLWLFGAEAKECHHRGQDPGFRLAFVLLAVQYGQLCLPCLLAIVCLPFFCFCLPCIVRWHRRGQRRDVSKGASEAAIQALPTKTFSDLHGESSDDLDPTCPICLVDFELDEELRVLPCKHHFHQGCVDEWLSKNSSCPSCRGDISSNLPREASGTTSLEPHI